MSQTETQGSPESKDVWRLMLPARIESQAPQPKKMYISFVLSGLTFHRMCVRPSREAAVQDVCN